MSVAFHPSRFEVLQNRVMRRGGTIIRDRYFSRPRVHWDIAGNCERPIVRELYSATPTKVRPDADTLRGRYDVATERTGGRTIEYSVRCRKCGSCLRTRAFQWRIRARHEISNSVRTWMGTLTMRPSEHVKAEYSARLRLAASGVSFDTLTEVEQLGELLKELGSEVTRWLKRVRKQSGAPLRYFLVVERHKSAEAVMAAGKVPGENAGRIHFHILVHETDESRPVRHEVLAKQWRLGFTKFNLVKDDKAAAYVAKYLSKTLAARVRASRGYGLGLDRLARLNDSLSKREPHDPPHKRKLGDCSNAYKGIPDRLPSGLATSGWREAARLSNAARAGDCTADNCPGHPVRPDGSDKDIWPKRTARGGEAIDPPSASSTAENRCRYCGSRWDDPPF